MKIELPWPPAELWPNRKANWRKLHAARGNQKAYAHIAMLEAKMQFPARATLLVTFHAPHKGRYDRDNAFAAMKGAVDGLAKASRCDDAGWDFLLKRGEARPGKGCVTFELIGDEK